MNLLRSTWITKHQFAYLKILQSKDLSKIRWIEKRHHAYDSCYRLFKSKIFKFEPILSSDLNNEFYVYLEKQFNKREVWDTETKIKAQGLIVVIWWLVHVLELFAVFNSLGPYSCW